MKSRISNYRVVTRQITTYVNILRARASSIEHWIVKRINKAPVQSFLILLGACVALIVIGNIMRRPKPLPTEAAAAPKQVSVYSIGESPKVQVSAKIEKSGVVTMVAQTAGIVQFVNGAEGTSVSRGTQLFTLSTNYQGGTIPSVTRAIAQKNKEFVDASFDTQKQMIDARRDIANASDAQADDYRNITNKSIDDTKTLISLNEEILSSLDSQLTYLESTNVGGANDGAIMEVKSAQSGVITGLNALKNGLRTSEYTQNEDNAPARISNLSRELTNKQLDIETKALELNRELSGLNLRIAQISESLMYPSSPVAGVIERINVRVGDNVNPGTILATIKGNVTTSTAVALVSEDLAKHISRLEPGILIIGDLRVSVQPRHISSEPTDGILHSVVFTVPDEYRDALANKSYLTVELPVSTRKSTASVPFVPIDAVYQTQSDAFLFVASKSAEGKFMVESKTVTLGPVIGSYVEILKGVSAADQVILDRTVSSGDAVAF